VTQRTVRRQWEKARLLMFDMLNQQPPQQPADR
jgi:hypothetical protein